MAVGRSQVTRFKHRNFRDIINHHIKICAKVIDRWDGVWKKMDKTYHLFDLTSGDMDSESSPRIICEELLEGLYGKVNFEACMFEKSRKDYNYLVNNMDHFISCISEGDKAEYFKQKVNLFFGDFRKFIDRLLLNREEQDERAFGLVIYDPNGFGWKDNERISHFMQKWKRLDLVYNFNLDTFKRSHGSLNPRKRFADNQGSPLSILRSFGKDRIFCRPLYKGDHHLWMLFFLTNSNFNICPPKQFINLDSDRGLGLRDFLANGWRTPIKDIRKFGCKGLYCNEELLPSKKEVKKKAFLTFDEVAKKLDVRWSTLVAYISMRKIIAEEFGRGWRFNEKDVEDFIALRDVNRLNCGRKKLERVGGKKCK